MIGRTEAHLQSGAPAGTPNPAHCVIWVEEGTNSAEMVRSPRSSIERGDVLRLAAPIWASQALIIDPSGWAVLHTP